MGPTPTLPPHHQPIGRDRRSRRAELPGYRDLVLDVDRALSADPDHDHAGDQDQEAVARLHRELVDADEAQRSTERPVVEAEPAGRRLPVPLTGHEGVER